MKKYMKAAAVLMLTIAVVCTACNKDPEQGSVTAPTGAIDAKFTVNASGGKVFFSKGNLQYDKTTKKWSFMDHQYDLAEAYGQDVGINYENQNVVSLFCWATSGYDHGAECYQPYSTVTTPSAYYAYGNSTYSLFDETGQADWGYNAISNGGNKTNLWRTPTKEELEYVFNGRSTSSGMRYAKSCVNNTNGVILLPDDWDSSVFSLNNTDSETAPFNSNPITASEWSTLEQHGAVFLPAAGYRNILLAAGVGLSGNYWSASRCEYLVGGLHFCDAESDLSFNNYYSCYGFSVRLVSDAQ